jgi:hypothetical protein
MLWYCTFEESGSITKARTGGHKHWPDNRNRCFCHIVEEPQEEPEAAVSGGGCGIHNMTVHCPVVFENVPILHALFSDITRMGPTSVFHICKHHMRVNGFGHDFVNR